MYHRIVIKTGTGVITGGTRHLDHGRMAELARQCAELIQQGKDLTIFNSGSISAGRERLGFPDLPNTLVHKQVLAAVGQSQLMFAWEQAFAPYNVPVAQILLSRLDIEDAERYVNAREMLHALIAQRIVPIINENDPVTTTAIRIGNNDIWAALVALVIEADLLILLTDQGGLYTADPRSHPEATLIPVVSKIDGQIYQLAGGSVSGLGEGGMVTKLHAVEIVQRGGTEVVIAGAQTPDVVRRVVQGEAVGTKFPVPVISPADRHQLILDGLNYK